ncbi:hypothetical protein CCS01_20855 [Rhodopila globiformis]|uniref:Uncharacterized protein n=1 Tax=Rhodopila globiformis TaxID=1071 RepID=A0A2S6N4Y0_RHOGL|nr:hypothetical protein CCS01_20855 [Rhodopila globiformis]
MRGGLPERTRAEAAATGSAVPRRRHLLRAAPVGGALPAAAQAGAAPPANDGHTVMDARKDLAAADRPGPDTVSVINVGADRRRWQGGQGTNGAGRRRSAARTVALIRI